MRKLKVERLEFLFNHLSQLSDTTSISNKHIEKLNLSIPENLTKLLSLSKELIYSISFIKIR